MVLKESSTMKGDTKLNSTTSECLILLGNDKYPSSIIQFVKIDEGNLSKMKKITKYGFPVKNFSQVPRRGEEWEAQQRDKSWE